MIRTVPCLNDFQCAGGIRCAALNGLAQFGQHLSAGEQPDGVFGGGGDHRRDIEERILWNRLRQGHHDRKRQRRFAGNHEGKRSGFNGQNLDIREPIFRLGFRGMADAIAGAGQQPCRNDEADQPERAERSPSQLRKRLERLYQHNAGQ